MEGIAKGIGSMLVFLVIVGFSIGGIIFVCVGYFVSNKGVLESKTILTPEKKLVTDGKTVDTLYIYKK